MRLTMMFVISCLPILCLLHCRHLEEPKTSSVESVSQAKLPFHVSVWHKTATCGRPGERIPNKRATRFNPFPDQYHYLTEGSLDLANKTLDQVKKKAEELRDQYCADSIPEQSCEMRYYSEGLHYPAQPEIYGALTEIEGCFQLTKACSTKEDRNCLASQVEAAYRSYCSQVVSADELEECVTRGKNDLSFYGHLEFSARLAKENWSQGKNLEEEIAFRKRHVSPDMFAGERLTGGLNYLTSIGPRDNPVEFLVILDRDATPGDKVPFPPLPEIPTPEILGDVTLWQKSGSCRQQGQAIPNKNPTRYNPMPDQYHYLSQGSTDLASKMLEHLMIKAGEFRKLYCEESTANQTCAMSYVAEGLHRPRETQIVGAITEIDTCSQLIKVCSTKEDPACLDSRIEEAYEGMCDRKPSSGTTAEALEKWKAQCISYMKYDERNNLHDEIQFRINHAKKRWSQGDSLAEELDFRRRHASPDMQRTWQLTGFTYVTHLRGKTRDSEGYLITLDEPAE